MSTFFGFRIGVSDYEEETVGFLISEEQVLDEWTFLQF
jgi:hypothetical protein